jgi:hypothetical protein
MYYTWAMGWWWLSSIMALVIIAWVLFGWNNRRYYSRRRYRYPGDDDWDDILASAYRHRHLQRQRGRGPRNYRRSDLRITEDINDRLLLHDEIDASDIEVQVNGGIATLNGSVQSRFEKRLAELVCESVAGVIDVDNRLKIGKPDQHLKASESAAAPGLPNRPA